MAVDWGLRGIPFDDVNAAATTRFVTFYKHLMESSDAGALI